MFGPKSGLCRTAMGDSHILPRVIGSVACPWLRLVSLASSRVLGSAPFPPPLRGSTRPFVSRHPGLAARATRRGRWRGRTTESNDPILRSHGSCGFSGPRSPNAAYGRIQSGVEPPHSRARAAAGPRYPEPTVLDRGRENDTACRCVRPGRGIERSDPPIPWIVRFQRAASGGRGLRQRRCVGEPQTGAASPQPGRALGARTEPRASITITNLDYDYELRARITSTTSFVLLTPNSSLLTVHLSLFTFNSSATAASSC